MDDALTQIETAFRTVLVTVAGEKSVFGPEDFPLRERDLVGGAILLDLGSEKVSYLGESEGGDRLIERIVQVDVMTVHDLATTEFRSVSRARSNAVRAALSDPRALGIEVEDLRLVGVQPQEYAHPSEEGSAGGFHHAFAVQFLSRESTPGVIEPRQ